MIPDHDVAGPEEGCQLLLDIGAKAFVVDRAVEDAWRGEPVAAQRAEKGQRVPVAMWGEAAQALPFRSPAAQRGHVGLDPGLVEEDEPSWIEAALPRAPALASAGDVGARLLKSEQRFF